MGWERKKHQILRTTSESDVVVDVVIDDRIGAVDHDSQTSQVKSFVQQSCPFWLCRRWCCVGRVVAPVTVFVSSSVVPSVSASASPVTILLKFKQITFYGLFQNKRFCWQKNWNDLDPKVLKEKMPYRNIGFGWIRWFPCVFLSLHATKGTNTSDDIQQICNCNSVKNIDAQSFSNSFEGVHGVVRKSGRGSSIFVFYCIFMLQFFKVFWGGTWGAPLLPPLPPTCVHLWLKNNWCRLNLCANRFETFNAF